MATLQDLRLQARLSVKALAELADVDRSTVQRAEDGQPVQDTKAYAIVDALAKRLDRKIAFRDVEGLNIL
jgi:predicted transcriptional regulator